MRVARLDWIPVRNNSSDDCPAFGALVPDGTGMDNRGILNCVKPAINGQIPVYFNSGNIIPKSGGTGQATRMFPLTAVYDESSAPIVGGTVGVQVGSYYLSTSQTGYTVLDVGGGFCTVDENLSPPASGVGWVQRNTDFTGWNFTWGSFDFTGTLVGSSIFLTGAPLNGLNWQVGDTITFSNGAGDTITGTVTNYTPAPSASLTFTVLTTTGTGVHTGVTGAVLALGGGLYPGKLYDKDLNDLQDILLKDANGNEPTIGVFYMAIRGSDMNGKQLWRTNVSGLVVLGVSCSPSNQPLAAFGPAL